MTKEHYLQREAELIKQLADLRKNYIDANKPYEIGQQLKIDGVASIVSDFLIGHAGVIVPICHKLEKDGTAHTARSYIWHHSKVELI